MSASRGERGSQAVELALVALVLLLVASALAPMAELALAQTRLSRAAADGLRFATRALPNPCVPGSAGCPFTEAAACSGGARRWPSQNEVTGFVRAAAGEDVALTVTVSPSPCLASSGQAISLTLERTHDLGPLALAANRVAVMVSGRTLLPTSVQVRSDLLGFQE
jgi:hypothetical protein